MIVKGIVKDFGKLIAEAERNIIEKIEDGRLETEPSITDRFLQEIERNFEEHGRGRGIRFRARTLRDRGRNAPEKEFGADFCGVLDVRLSEFKLSKGFLAQSKSDSRGININRGQPYFHGVTFLGGNEYSNLRDQIDKMLTITPDSFVIIYSTTGFVVVPASSVKGLKYPNSQLYGKSMVSFFKEFLMCFIGDPKLNAYDDQTLEKLRDATFARSAIMFQIEEQ